MERADTGTFRLFLSFHKLNIVRLRKRVRKKSTAAVVAVIVIIIITIVLLSLLYSWVFGVSSETTQVAERTVKTYSEQLYCVRIDQVAKNRVYLRNCGPWTIRNETLNILLDGRPVEFSLNREIKENEVGFAELFDLYRFGIGSHDLTVSVGSTVLKRKVRVAPDPSAIAFWDFEEPNYLTDYDRINGLEAKISDGVCWAWKGEFNGHFYESYYLGCADALQMVPTWSGTLNFCRSRGGYLPVVSSDLENEFLTNRSGASWIGFFQDSDGDGVPDGNCAPGDCWTWLSDETSTYTNWAPGQPDDAREGEDCASFWQNYTGDPYFPREWFDLPCNFIPDGFICEYTSDPGALPVEPESFYPPRVEDGKVLLDGYDDVITMFFTGIDEPKNRISVFITVRKPEPWSYDRWILFRPKSSLMWDDPSYGLFLSASDVLKACVQTTVGYTCSEAKADFSDLEYHTAGLVYNGTHVSVYFDGSLLSPVQQTGEILYPQEGPKVLRVGGNSGVNLGKLEVDDIMIFSDAVDPKTAFGLR